MIDTTVCNTRSPSAKKVEARAPCRVARASYSLAYAHNGPLAALFPKVTHAEFFRKELESTFVFDGEEIKLFLISPWEKFVAYRERCKVEV